MITIPSNNDNLSVVLKPSPIFTPVVLIIFNRPEPTKKVFEAIAAAKPKELFVIADGPRPNRPEDIENCLRARAVTEQVDWDCEVHRNYAEKNLGCGICPATGIDWVFSQVEDAIILEDDCVPTPSFFPFCQQLLARYRNNERVMQISGDNFFADKSWSPYSYYFSRYSHNWGWATWRRAWLHFDLHMRLWPEVRASSAWQHYFEDPLEQAFWTKLFDKMYQGSPDIWDNQWVFACMAHSGLTIMPARNLVTNIGSGVDSTHTGLQSPYVNVPASDIWTIKHPPYLVRHRQADINDFQNYFGGKQMRFYRTPWGMTYRLLRCLLHPVHTYQKYAMRSLNV